MTAKNDQYPRDVRIEKGCVLAVSMTTKLLAFFLIPQFSPDIISRDDVSYASTTGGKDGTGWSARARAGS